MNETDYHRLAGATLERICAALEKADEKGFVEMEETGEMVSIVAGGKEFIVSKHVPTRQLWLSSPMSGGLHFSYDEAKKDWLLPDQRSLMPLLMDELKQWVEWRT
jgi:frataxin